MIANCQVWLCMDQIKLRMDGSFKLLSFEVLTDRLTIPFIQKGKLSNYFIWALVDVMKLGPLTLSR